MIIIKMTMMMNSPSKMLHCHRHDHDDDHDDDGDDHDDHGDDHDGHDGGVDDKDDDDGTFSAGSASADKVRPSYSGRFRMLCEKKSTTLKNQNKTKLQNSFPEIKKSNSS